jgi:Carboxypeptidase regulatory-like domain
MAKWQKVSVFSLLAFLIAGCIALQAQSIFGDINGSVTDASGAVVPNAKVTLTNSASGDVRRGVTNGDGYYSFSSVPAGSYSLLVDAAGFTRAETKDIALQGAQTLRFDMKLQVGSATTEVQVVSASEQITPTDSGEKAVVLTQKQLQNFTIVGANAAEFIKILPGFAATNGGDGLKNGSNYTGEVIGINGNGDGGSQSPLNSGFQANGQINGSIDITADGAHVSDPGCNCATPVNPNTDMIQEFKVLTSNFSAENAKGPIVINSVAKAGGKDFHGEGYFSARNYALNANDWVNNYTGVARPENQFYYPGGNIGGPVLIPGTHFNKNRDKLFFFTGYEYYYQQLDTGLLGATVPTAGMRNGNFSPSELAMLGAKTAGGGPSPAPNMPGTSTPFPGGIIPPSYISPIGQGLMNVYPLPNANPNANGCCNYLKDEVFPQNSYQWLTRVDYSISDNTKLFVRYNLQQETQQFPVTLWWRNAQSVPYPTPVLGKNSSQSTSASLTHVFSPTLSNEAVFSFTYIGFPNVFQDPAKVDRNSLGIPFSGIYKNGVQQIPAMTGWGGSEFATIFNPGGFEAGGPTQGLYADKWLPNISDTLSFVKGTHTMKFGFYWEYVINKQPANGYTNGQFVEADWAGVTGNAWADLLNGYANGYTEQNFNNINDEAYSTYEGFAQDSWKASSKLTLDYGIRLSHLGPWYDKEHYGFPTWNPALYNPNAPASDYTGFQWNAINKNVPLSGFGSRALFYAPRIGAAYDVFGTGNTVLRGGWGMFYYHNSQFTQGLGIGPGVETTTVGGNATFAQIEATNPALSFLGAQGVNGNDNSSPVTYSYSATISQRLKFASLLEVSYVGNKADHLLSTTGVGTDANALPYGALFHVGVDPGTLNGTQAYVYSKYPTYQAVNIAGHLYYSNYNSLQVTWVRQKGNYDFSVNYTLSKAMNNMVGNDQTNLANDYGAAAFDHRHIFNAAYSIVLPGPIKNNKAGEALVNGWQLSGIIKLQSGVNLTANSNSANYNVGGGITGLYANNGYKNSTINAASINGTISIPLQPILTCNPTENLKPHQYLNGNCFSVPTTPGTNGGIVLPEYFGPWFYNGDLSLFKNFNFSESKKLQFRFSAYNFLNHPVWSFDSAGVGASNLYLTYNAQGQQTNTSFGYAPVKLGHRVVEMTVKFYF